MNGRITVQQLGKAYRQYPARWSRLAEWMLPFVGPLHRLHWVLQDVGFDIAPGESVGLIGVNGAGKSTLLKLITGTTQPSAGFVQAHGRVAALLELGLGFQPDFTGRQNVLVAGQLLGLGVDEVRALLPGILEFADIGDYIDQPVRVYSSGMQMRLAFAVATCVRPDVLIVDEALAVGDVFFQQKCFARIESFTKAGTTLLFVSHSAGTVLNICDRCIFLRNGRVAFDGAPADALDLYQAELLGRLDQAPDGITVQNGEPAPVPAGMAALAGKTGSITTPLADCVGVRLIDQHGNERNALLADQRATLQIDYLLHQAADDPHVGFKIRNRFGAVLYETNSYCMRQAPGPVPAGSVLTAQFTMPLALFPDEYTITVGLGDGGYGEGSFRQVLNYLHEVTSFAVLQNPDSPVWSGLVNLAPQLRLSKH
ncbi:ABC transporter ATP-binding protein [Pseudoduganella buxea]|uniref:ABC transporter n=1 Tax=Pseudoduganella buxea TaxID=1949069 RepID=A0A6I3SVV5_9BURK|nr:ABC transporter ATP-binding protein [Pseudoduganella buxea]MTV53388.1 ATP-binding cassette domain-containing protein [Pseudoduganella buxea]GGC07099.1 ABC transporter [Pseudoduganella buxea]